MQSSIMKTSCELSIPALTAADAALVGDVRKILRARLRRLHEENSNRVKSELRTRQTKVEWLNSLATELGQESNGALRLAVLLIPSFTGDLRQLRETALLIASEPT